MITTSSQDHCKVNIDKVNIGDKWLKYIWESQENFIK